MSEIEKVTSASDLEIAESILRFGAELTRLLVEAKSDTQSDTQELYETGDLAYDYQPRAYGIISCIEEAAQDAEWYSMAGLASAVRTSMEHYQSQAMQNNAAHRAKESQLKHEKREASKQRRLEKEAALPPKPILG